MEKLLTVEQASVVLSVHGETVRQWLRSGKLRGVKMGHRSWRVPEGALRELTARDNSMAKSGSSSATRIEARRALETLAAGTRAGLPPLPDEALTSESLYAGCGEVTENRARGDE